MTDEKKPRKFHIISKVGKDEDATPKIEARILDEELDLAGVIIDDGKYDDEDDDDIYDPTMAGYDPRIAGLMDEDDEELAFLIDCAMDWLPELPMLESLFEHGVNLDYGVLVSAKIITEELGESVDEGRLDAMLSTLMLFGEDDENNRREYYELLTADAQELVLMLDEALHLPRHEDLEAAPHDARMLMLAGIISDVEVAGEMFEDDGELPAYENLQHAGALMQTLSANGDLPPRLIQRAQDMFNIIANSGELPLHLMRDGGRLMLTDAPPVTAHKPKPPRP